MAPRDKIRLIEGKEEGGVLVRFTNAIAESPIVDKAKEVVSNSTYILKKLSKSTGKAMWYTATWVLILGVPLIIELDREQQLNELEQQQATLLGPTSLGLN